MDLHVAGQFVREPSVFAQTVPVLVGERGRPHGQPGHTLMAIAEACRRHERLRFDYASPRGGQTVRDVEPYNLVSFVRRWYLVAWDTDRGDWRTFRVDRLEPRTPTGPRFAPRQPPHGDVAAYLAHQLSTQAWPYRATVILHKPANVVADRLAPGLGVI